ncbi:MAG TPA: tripartite tricarboxylate transporter substrate binding protein [Burkholderiales bacterium]|nr:tripartite tricarboxylate transporter substrate binding protein [Burkholderiales bacterium]
MKLKTIVAAAAAALTALPAGAQSWPAKPVIMIVPFPPGGGTEAFARPLAATMSKQIGQQVIIDNRGGAGGTLGASIAARGPKDGHSIFMGAVHHAIAPSVYKKLEYNIEKDFVPLAVVAVVPQVIVVNAKRVAQRDLRSFLEYAKKNPGKLNYASAGNGTSHHLAGELFKQIAGVDLAHVPYKGAGPALQDLIAGQVDLMFDGLGSSAQHIKSGSIHPLAVASATRSFALPYVPTAAEAGVKGYVVTTWYALWAPAGVPKDVQDRLVSEINKGLAAPEVKRVWESQGATVGPNNPKDMAGFVTAEIAKWAKVAKSANIQID